MLKFIIWGVVAFGLNFSDSYNNEVQPSILQVMAGLLMLAYVESMRWCIAHQVAWGSHWEKPTWKFNLKIFGYVVFSALIAGSFSGYWASTGVWYSP